MRATPPGRKTLAHRIGEAVGVLLVGLVVAAVALLVIWLARQAFA